MRAKRSNLRYLVFNLHDTNLSNLLRFFGYWDKYGYEKHVKFSSSIRLEILKVTNKVYSDWNLLDLSLYYVRVVYDDEEIHLPFCEELYCKFEELTQYVTSHLITD
jgi:hypothetical protein